MKKWTTYKRRLLELQDTLNRNMEKYCKIIDSDATTKCKIDFTRLMGNVAERIKVKCDKLEKELENEQAHRESSG